MDLFFAAARVQRRQQPNSLHRFMQDCPCARRVPGNGANPDGEEPIPPLAHAIAADAALLCFDEFQVQRHRGCDDLGRLFPALFDRGVVVVGTSNAAPDDLSQAASRGATPSWGQRPGSNMSMCWPWMPGAISGARGMRGLPTWHSAGGRAGGAGAGRGLRRRTGPAAQRGNPARCGCWAARWSSCRSAARGRGRASDFPMRCAARPLGAGDYLALATHCHTLVLDGVPRLGPENFDRARRFITLVDALYEHRCKLVVSAAAPPDLLYEQGENAAMFERTASRLMEMQARTTLRFPT